MSLINSNYFSSFLAAFTSPHRHQIAELQIRREHELTKNPTYYDLLKRIRSGDFLPLPTGIFTLLDLSKLKNLKEIFTLPTTTPGMVNFTNDELTDLIAKLIPWRKGPYNFQGMVIDSEWNSSIKWNILEPELKNCLAQMYKEHTNEPIFIADLGCNNGYFMHRIKYELLNMFKQKLFIVGYEPVLRNALQFVFLQTLLNKSLEKKLSDYTSAEEIFLLLGYEHLNLFANTYNLILALGVLYHYPDPIGLLTLMYHALKPGGTIIIDCQGIPGDTPITLFPGARYTGKRSFWFLPTLETLNLWIKKAGFNKYNVLHVAPIHPEEQRSTPLAPGDSLKAGLIHAENYFAGDIATSSTIENYPPPVRFYLSVTKS